jgi:HAD superfamily hydrolase (TIGR01509 family)
MQALFLGSIGTLSDTSELQREAYNTAFAEAGLDWHWDRSSYRQMLALAGGRERIERYAAIRGATVDAEALHRAKRRRFHDELDWGRARVRPGVIELLDEAEALRLPTALVTTADPDDLDHLLAGIGMDRSDFGIVVDATDVVARKPASDCYHLACARLAVAPERCLAVEDNPAGVEAAAAAGLHVLAWPGANTRGLDFGTAPVVEAGSIREAALGALEGAPVPAG